MTNTPATKYFATGIAAVVLTFGAYMIGKSNTGASTSSGANAAQRFAPPGQSGQQGQAGQPPQGGFGTPVTGPTLAKLKSVVAAKYPGQVERADKRPDGSYEVHVIGSSGEAHVLVSKDFQITGTQQGGGRPPSSGSGSGSSPSSATTS